MDPNSVFFGMMAKAFIHVLGQPDACKVILDPVSGFV